jgi:methyl-accepting chemotaxis protein
MRELGSASNAMAGLVQDIADMADRNGQNAQAAAEAAAVLNASAQTLTQSVARFRVPA